jgi:hypothetical protein
MDNIISNFTILETLSKQISDLIYNNNYDKVYELDLMRQSIIKDIIKEKSHDHNIKNILKNLITQNESLIFYSESNLENLKKNQSKFNKRLKAYNKTK